jgi:hypothetical protein
MKNFSLLLFFASFAFVHLNAQTTAVDFTAGDCNTGASHNLFSELNQGNVVVLEFAMMNCVPCVTAGKGIEDIVAEFASTGKVKFYTFGFDNSIDCADMLDWLSDNSMEHLVFAGDETQLDYYGGMGMPTVVVTGNASHKVYYQHLGYSPSQNHHITTAIEEALADGTTGIGSAGAEEFAFSPNPFGNFLDVQVPKSSAINEVVLANITGKTVLSQNMNRQSSIRLLTEQLSPGIYFLNLKASGQIIRTMKVVKRS